MVLTVRARSLAKPYPYDARFELGAQAWNVMLVAQPYDVLAEQLKGLAGVVPTSYAGSSLDPTIEGVRIFRHWIDGLGERHRQADDSHLYYLAEGVDASCGGTAILGPEQTAVTPTGAGGVSLEKIVHWPGITAPRLFALAGSNILIADQAAGDPGVGADWRVLRDFSLPAPTPPAPSVGTGGVPPAAPTLGRSGTGTGPWTQTYGYKVVAIFTVGVSYSAASNETTLTSEVHLTAGVDEITISWVAPAGATRMQVWRTTAPGIYSNVTGLIYDDVVGAGTSFTDTDALTALSGGTPPATGVAGSTSYSYRLVAYAAGGLPRSAAGGTGSTSTGAATLSASLPNVLTWTPTAGYSYQIWRTVAGGTGASGTTGLISAGGISPFIDDGIAATTALPIPAGDGQTVTDLFVHAYGGVYYILVGLAPPSNYQYYDGAAWFNGALPGTHFTNLRGQLYRAHPSTRVSGPNVASAAISYSFGAPGTPSGVGWTALNTDSDMSQAITNMFSENGGVLVFTRDRIYLAGTPNATGEDITPVAVAPSDENGRGAFIFNGDVYAPFGNAWWKITVTSPGTAQITSTGLDRFVENVSAVEGPVRAGAAHNNWFAYFSVWSGVDSYCLKLGSWANPGETNSHLWEFRSQLHGAIAKIAGHQVRSAFISQINGTNSVANPRLFLGLDDGTLRLLTLPLLTPSPIGDPACRFTSEGTITFGIDDFGFGANDKAYHRAALLGANFSENHGVVASYALDASGDFINFDATWTQNGASLDFPAAAEGKLLQPRLRLFTGDATETPEVNTLLLFAQVREFTDADGNPAFRRRRRVVISAEDWMVNNQGLSDKLENARHLRDGLQQLAAAPSAHLILRDGVRRQIGVLAWSEGLVIGPGGQETYAVTLDYLESALATGRDAGGPLNPGWGP